MPDQERTETIILTGSDAPARLPGASLVVIAGPGVGRQLILGNRPAVVGRHPSCELAIESSSVSRQHAVFEVSDNRYRVKDMGSKNGTVINGARVSEHDLADGDVIKLGKAVLKFVQSESAEARYLLHLSQISATDSLTGLANRRSFDEALRNAIGRVATVRTTLSLILIDIDHFKSINDEYGHPAGDHVLQVVAKLIRGEVRESDLVSRIGGEELAVLCSGITTKGIHSLAERIRGAVERTAIVYEGRRIRVTVSLGVCTREAEDTADAAELYKRADKQLYVAKRSGRNCVAASS